MLAVMIAIGLQQEETMYIATQGLTRHEGPNGVLVSRETPGDALFIGGPQQCLRVRPTVTRSGPTPI